MTTAIARSLTALDLLSEKVKEGQQFKVVTDTELYGMTVKKENGYLINVRTGEPISVSSELLKSKFHPVVTDSEKPLSLEAAIVAYQKGNIIRIERGDRVRFIQKKESPIPKELLKIMPMMELEAVTQNDFFLIDEIIGAKFYIEAE